MTMNDSPINAQLDAVSAGRGAELVSFVFVFSSAKLSKDFLKDPTESLEDSGYNCVSKEKLAGAFSGTAVYLFLLLNSQEGLWHAGSLCHLVHYQIICGLILRISMS